MRPTAKARSKHSIVLMVLALLSVCCACTLKHHNLDRIRIDYAYRENGSGGPDYDLTILGNGTVLFRGNTHVGVPGMRHYSLPPARIGEIVDAIHQSGFSSMEAKSRSVVFDCPVQRLHFFDGEQDQTVTDNCRQVNNELGLWTLGRELERLSGVQKFVYSSLADYALLTTEDWNVNSPGRYGWTAMDYTAAHRDAAASRFLLDHGALPSKTAFNFAAHWGDISTLTMLLSRAHFDEQTLNDGACAASRSRDADALELLLQAGGNAKGEAYERPLVLCAVSNASGAAIRVLVRHGADVNVKDRHGQTALMMAASGYDSGIVEQLIVMGSKTNDSDDQGRTALMYAADHCFYWNITPLLAAGADPHLRDHDGRTALDLVRCGPLNDEKVRRTMSLLRTALQR